MNLPSNPSVSMLSSDLIYRYSTSTDLNCDIQDAFAFLDDPKRLASHMESSSWMMAGSRMSIELDALQGCEVGSEITLRGDFLRIPLFIRERICVRKPPSLKIWETVGPQKLLIIDQYRMGFELARKEERTRLMIFIEYTLPPDGLQRLLGYLFSGYYARWCTKRMSKDARTFLS